MRDDGLSTLDRRALAAVATQFFVNGAIFASFVPRLPEIRDEIGVGNDTLGVLLALGALAGLIGSGIIGRMVQRFGTARLLLVAGIALCASLTVIGAATTPVVFVLGFAALSVFDVQVDSAMNLQGSWISGRRSAPVMNRLHGLWSLGTVAGGVAAARLAALDVSLRTHLTTVSVLMLVAVVVVSRLLLRRDEHVTEAPTDSTGVARRNLRPLVFLAMLAAASVAMEMTSNDWAAIRLRDDLGASPGVAGLGFVGFTVGMTAGRFGGDSAIARWGADRVARAGIVVTIVGLVVAAFVPVAAIVVAGYSATGLGVATQFPKLYDDAARHPGRPGAGLGALTAGSRVMYLITPVVVGTIAASRLSVGAATAVVTIPAALVFVFLVSRSKRT